MSVLALTLEGEAVADGKFVVALDDIWEAIDSKELAAEVRDRLSDGDATVLALADEIAPNEDQWAEDSDEGELFRHLSDWDREELKRAVAVDDGRRVIDLLRRKRAA